VFLGLDSKSYDGWLGKRQIKINRSCVKGRYAQPKTKGSQRAVGLLDGAYDALAKQKELIMMTSAVEVSILQEVNRKQSNESLNFFINMLTNRPYGDSQNL
jgi:hypothetical protein